MRLVGAIFLALAPGEGRPGALRSHMEILTEVCTADGLKEIWMDSEYNKEATSRPMTHGHAVKGAKGLPTSR